jgi:sortase (surface protein transpeptidase)
MTKKRTRKSSKKSKKSPLKSIHPFLLAFFSFIITVVVLLALQGFQSPDKSDTDDLTPPPAFETYTPTAVDNCQPSDFPGRPYLISIPSVDIHNVCIEEVSVGRKARGQLDDPVDIWQFGWYIGSPAPGTEGQSVFTCHSGYPPVRAICDNLVNLPENAYIVVEISTGQKFTYQVVEIKTLSRNAVDMTEFQSVPSGHTEGLSLMTCTGALDTTGETMVDRLTVRAVLLQ